MKYRFTKEDFSIHNIITVAKTGDSEMEIVSVTLTRAEATELANAKLEDWEEECERIYGREDPKTKQISRWTARAPVKGPATLHKDDYTHKAFIWNPRPFEEKK